MKLCNVTHTSRIAVALSSALALAACGGGGGSDDSSDGGGGGGGGGGSTATFNGTLENQNFHPLKNEIASGGIKPDKVEKAEDCPTGTDDGFDDAKETVTVFGKTFPVCVISSDFLGNSDTDVADKGDTFKLTNDHVYLLNGSISVGDGGDENTTATDGSQKATKLVIEAGTQIMAVENSKAALRVTRGSQIDVNGTQSQPVIFGAAQADVAAGTITGDPTDLSGRGQWGGVVVDGFAPINDGDGSGANGNEKKSEAAPSTDQDTYFGGNSPSNDAGEIDYAVIGESGFAFAPDQEVQGLTVEGVSSNFSVNHLQVLGSEDDGVEWFGGASNFKHVVINGVDDDSLDMDEGFRGTIQYAIVRIGVGQGDSAVEADNLGKSPFDQTPKSEPNIGNLTVLGNAGKGASAAVNHKEGFSGQFYQSVYHDDVQSVAPSKAGFQVPCLKWEDEVDISVVHKDVVFFCNGSTDVTGTTTAGLVNGGESPGGADFGASPAKSNEAGSGGESNSAGNPTRVVTGEDLSGSLNAKTLAVNPSKASAPGDMAKATSGAPGGALSENDYFGAVDPNASAPAWWQGWTVDVKN